MPGLKSSANSPASKLSRHGAAIAFVALAALSIYAAYSSWVSGATLAYGDAESHLDIARRLFDSRTPGPSQIGTVWLPLPHLLMAPFAAIDPLWFNGVAGMIPSLASYLLAAVLFYRVAGMVAAVVFALNLNMLYLATTPMTEPIMAAAIAGLLYAMTLYREAPTDRRLLAVAAVSNLASLTRYEGWFLIPFIAILIWRWKGLKHAALFAALASIAPLAWLAHNQFYYGDPLAFYRGPYSAQAILAKQIASGMTQPAMQSWWETLRYYGYAVRDVIGTPVLIAAVCGAVVAIRRGQAWKLGLLALPAVFYVLSIHSGGTPVFVKELEPFTWYNTRYALALLPFAAVAIAALPRSAVLLVAIASVLLIRQFPVIHEAPSERPNAVIDDYRPGSGIVFRFDTLAGVFRLSHIPFREGLYQDNLPQWNEALANPQVFQQEEWALAEEGDEVDQAVHRQGDAYALVNKFNVKGKPAILLYRRSRQ